MREEFEQARKDGLTRLETLKAEVFEMKRNSKKLVWQAEKIEVEFNKLYNVIYGNRMTK